MVVEGVMLGNLPWNLVLIGVFLSLAMWILGIPVLAVAIGVYLPIHLSAPIMVGGLLRRYMESRNFADAAERTNCVQSGVLYSSGLIAGEGLIGILLAILAVMDLDLDMSKTINLGNVGACRLCPSCGDHLRSLPEGPEIPSLILSVGCQAADYRNQSLDFGEST